MRKTLVVMGLLAVAAVMLVSASEVDQHKMPACCYEVRCPYPIKNIIECLEQKKRVNCEYDAYLIKTPDSGKNFWCLDITLPWLKDMIKKGEIKCPPVIKGETSEMKS